MKKLRRLRENPNIITESSTAARRCAISDIRAYKDSMNKYGEMYVSREAEVVRYLSVDFTYIQIL